MCRAGRGTDSDPAHLAFPDVVADLEPRASRQKPREALGSSCGRVLVWILMSMEVTLRALADARFSIPDRPSQSQSAAGTQGPHAFTEARPRDRSVA